MLDHLFAHASKFVYIVAACYPAGKTLPDGSNAHCTVRPPRWWVEHVRRASARRPGVRWTLCAKKKSYLAFEHRTKLRKKGISSKFFHG